MPVRHVLLGALAVVVLGLVVYVFVEVRSSPAASNPRSAPIANAKDDNTDKDDKDKDKDDKPEPETPAKPPRERDTRRGGPGAISRIARKPAGSGVEAAPTVAPPDAKSNAKLEAMMAEANKAYDKQDFDEAKTIARKVLLQAPNNARMLRVLVSTACVDHDAVEAQKHYNLLTDPSDRQIMRTRCQRDFGITLNDTVKK